MNPFRLPPPPQYDRYNSRQWWARIDPDYCQYITGQHEAGEGHRLTLYRNVPLGGDWYYERNSLSSIKNVNLGPRIFWK